MIQVVCAIILKEDKILICQRSAEMKLPLKWEFPGGKIEIGETYEESLIREIDEELGLNIKVNQALTPVKHHYPDFSIELIPFMAEIIDGQLKPTEHQTVKWVNSEELNQYGWATADIPIVEELIQKLNE